MREENDDLMVLEEGQGQETPTVCTCTTTIAKIK
jgi:hypothetical protein